jgi:hypothetical protein
MVVARRSWREIFGEKLGKAGRKRKGAKKRAGRFYPRAELDRRDQVTATKSWPRFLRKGEQRSIIR